MHNTTIKRLESNFFYANLKISEVEQSTSENKATFKISTSEGDAYVFVKHDETFGDCINLAIQRLQNLKSLREVLNNTGESDFYLHILAAVKHLQFLLDPEKYGLFEMKDIAE